MKKTSRISSNRPPHITLKAPSTADGTGRGGVTTLRRLYCPIVGLLALCLLTSCATIPSLPGGRQEEKVSPMVVSSAQGEDALQKAYADFLMGALHVTRGRYQEAKVFLGRAIEGDPDSAYLQREMAVLLKELKDYKGALEHAKKCVGLNPKNLGCRFLLAEIYTLSHDEDAARGEYESLLELDPGQQRARLLLVTLLTKKGQYEKALEQINRLLQDDPGLVIAHYYRGRIYMEMRNLHEAEKSYVEALRLNQKMEPALFDLGSLYQMDKKFEKAAEIYEKLLGAYPLNSLIRERLINIYFTLGLEEKARHHMREIERRSKPGDPGRQTLGLIYLRHGKLDESIGELEMILSAFPEDHKSRYYLATAYEEKGELDKALENFGRISPDSEHYMHARIHTAYILDNQDKHDEAIRVLDETIHQQPGKVELYLMLASLLEGRKEYAKAIQALEEALKQHPKNAEVFFRMGVVLDKSGDKEGCLTRMRQVLEVQPDHADALNYIGYTYAEQGIRLDEALELIEKALKSKPDSGYIIDSLGWVYYQKGLVEEAIRHLEKAASLVPNDPTITEHLGDAYYKKKDYKKALQLYEKALSLNHPSPEKIKERIEKVKRLLR